jgi:hypothetical protein
MHDPGMHQVCAGYFNAQQDYNMFDESKYTDVRPYKCLYRLYSVAVW